MKRISLVFLGIVLVSVFMWKVSDDVKAGDFTIGSSGETATFADTVYHSQLNVGVPAFYTIYKNGSVVKAINGATGHIDTSGTDAVTVIQFALDSLSSGRTWKEKVVLKGDFEFASTLQPDSYTILELQGRVSLADSVNVHLLQNAHTATGDSHIEIRGGRWNGNKTNQTSDAYMCYFQRVTDLIIRDLEAYDFYGDAIHIRVDSDRALIQNVSLHDMTENGGIVLLSDSVIVNNLITYNNGSSGGNGFMIGHGTVDTTYNVLLNNILSYSNSQNGIYIVNSKNVRCNGIVSNNTYSGISVSTSCDVVIDANVFENMLSGISLDRVNRFQISGTAKDNNRGDNVDITYKNGIIINSTSGASNNGSIIGVDVSDDQASPLQNIGIFVEADASNISILGGRAENNALTGIYDLGCTNLVISDVVGYKTENSGVTSVANGGKIAHGLVDTATAYIVIPTVINHLAAITAVDADSMTIALSDTGGTAITTPENVSWWAEIR